MYNDLLHGSGAVVRIIWEGRGKQIKYTIRYGNKKYIHFESMISYLK